MVIKEDFEETHTCFWTPFLDSVSEVGSWEDIGSSRWKFQALDHKLLQALTVKVRQLFQAFKYSPTTWPVDSSPHRWTGPLQEIFKTVLNSSNRNANLSSLGRSREPRRRKRRDFCYGLVIKASKSRTRARGLTTATTWRSLQLWRRYRPIQSPKAIKSSPDTNFDA